MFEAGQGIGLIKDIAPVNILVERFLNELEDAHKKIHDIMDK